MATYYMAEAVTDNQTKQKNYAEQFKRLRKALISGFYLEAMFIEYAIMEDRTESILRHGGWWAAYLKKRKGKEPTINSKITCIQGVANSGDKLMHKYFSDNLLDRMLAWKDERNRLIHALLKQQLTDEEVAVLAEQGYEIACAMRSRANGYNQSVEKAIKKQNGCG